MYDNWYAVQVRSGQEQEIIKKCEILIQRDIYEISIMNALYQDIHMKKFREKCLFNKIIGNIREMLIK